MITSIKVGKSVITNPTVKLDAGNLVRVSKTDNTISIGNSELSVLDDKYTEYLNKLRTEGLPFVTAVSGVPADARGNIWLLGDKTAQVDLVDGSFTLCDMSQTVDYPRIYKSVYAMLRQIRLWLDAHKDTLLLKTGMAESKWAEMLNDADDWDIPTDSPDSRPMFKESRSRSEISAIGPGLNLINEYRGTVSLWNYIVGMPASKTTVRLHPADKSGVYIGTNLTVPVTDKIDTTITVRVSINIKGQPDDGIDGLYLWMRCPVARATPSPANVSIFLPGQAAESSIESVLDEGSKQIELKSDTPIHMEASITIPRDEVRTSYIVQAVFEAVPFILCSDKESTYADSKKGIRYNVADENKWIITTEVYRNGTLIRTTTDTKNTAMAPVCDDPDASESGDAEI